MPVPYGPFLSGLLSDVFFILALVDSTRDIYKVLYQAYNWKIIGRRVGGGYDHLIYEPARHLSTKELKKLDRR